MTLSKVEVQEIEATIRNSLRDRFENYAPEPAYMPFHTRLLGKDRLALYSFIHSLNTNFGTTIFEPVALVLAKKNFKIAKSHTTAGEFISEGAQFEIQKIMDNLTTAISLPNKSTEIEAIRNVCQKGTMRKIKPTKVDILLESKTGELYLFDLKTAKPNAGGFKEFKRTLLEWVATVLYSNPNTKINTIIAIPYNPYEPQPYNRWTIRGMLDLEKELKVANEFWDFLGGVGAYQDLLECFERVGIELRSEIDNYFKKFN
ncbi:MAG: TdeIII family type II restriction endonuclease [Planctomycetes bacterium]|nr:TdeIII family type II restriction endonuclease [Planctomycetota bacterium]